MKNGNPQSSERFWPGVCGLVLLLLPVGLTFLMWEDLPRLILCILNGSLFRQPWTTTDAIRHAGFCMDQPTIGKYYFWATVFGGLWTIAAFGSARLCRRSREPIRRLYAAGAPLCAAVYLILLTLPFTLTIKYIHLMGFTPHRWIALAWGLSGYLLITGLTAVFVRGMFRTDISK